MTTKATIKQNLLCLIALFKALMLFVFLFAPTAAANQITSIDVVEESGGYQVSIGVAKSIGFAVETLGTPFRLELNFIGLTGTIPKKIPKNFSKFAKSMSLSKRKNGEKLIFETVQPMLIRSARYNDTSTSIVLDLIPTDADTFVTFLKLKAEQSEQVAEVVEPTPVVPEPISGPPKVATDTKRVIVIDAGHGGIDPGALGKMGTKEKDVVLAFANALKSALEKHTHFEVRLSRAEDTYITLPARVKFARDAKADLLLSIHADIVRGQTARGATLYTLSETASDAEAEAFAAKENKVDLIAGITLPEGDNDVGAILANLMQRETQNHSNFFARKVAEHVRGVTKMTGKPVRSADFAVLTAPDVPSALIELGFLSSSEDEKLLQDPKWRQTVANAMAQSIEVYFSEEVAVNSISRAYQGD